MVPLGSLLNVRRVLGSELITRYNLYPAATITGIPMPRFSSGEALSFMEQTAANILPQGMDYEWTGLSYQEKLIGSQAYLIFALSITLVFLVLAAQYESWTDPAAVILTVPMALVGIVIALLIRRFPNDLYTQIGLVLMIALGREERDSDRGVRAGAQGGGHVGGGCGGRSDATSLSADPDDVDRVHLGRRPAPDRHRRRLREPAISRHRGVRRYDRLDVAGDTLRAGLLYNDAAR